MKIMEILTGFIMDNLKKVLHFFPFLTSLVIMIENYCNLSI